jgi:zinc protease
VRNFAAILALAAAPLIAQTAAPAKRPVAARKPAEVHAAEPSYKDLKFPPLRPVQIPKVETFTLADGMRVYLLEDHELPIVNGTALVRTGNLFDPADKVGLATITGMVMRTGGTRTKTGDELDRQLEDIAASVESGIGETSGSVSFSSLKENAPEVLAAFKDVLTAPAFRQEKFDLARTQLRSSIARRNDSAAEVAGREFDNLLYGKDTPYGWQIEYATLNRISRGDLEQFYRRYFFPRNVMLAIRGDFDSARMKTQLETLFADWTVQQPPVPAFPKVAGKISAGTFLGVKKDVTQTFFSIGELGGELRDKDFPALEIMADILGGGFQSRLVRRVRTQMGAAYDISADWGADYDHPGLFTISGSTKSFSTVETIQAIREELERIRTTEVTEEELNTAKQTALNSLVFAYDTKAKTLGRMLTYEYYGYPGDFIQQYQKALAAVTRADVLRAAKEHVDPAKLAVVAVGNPVDFGKPLESLGGRVTALDLTIPAPKQEATQADADSLARGRRLLVRVQQAVGGADRLAAIKDSTEISQFTLSSDAGGMKATETDRWLGPDHFRQESQLPEGRITVFYDPGLAWITTPQGAGLLAGAQLKQVQSDLFRVYWRLLLSDRDPSRVVNAVDGSTLEISGKSGELVRVVVDPETGLPNQVLYENPAISGPAVPVQETWADFRDVAGVKVPFAITIVQGGRKFADVVVNEVKVNQGLKLEELQRRQ